jgi:hypothetical protein
MQARNALVAGDIWPLVLRKFLNCSVPGKREIQMNWLRRKKKEEPVPGSVDEGLEIPLNLESLDLDLLVNMSNNVMWCRENLDAMLVYITEHRSDEHECLPFCLPRGIDDFLNKLDKSRVMMLLIVLMKDLEVSYAPEEPAS